jgi:hypothetical protein
MAGAPDLFGIGTVLNDAIQVSAGGGKRPEVIVLGSDENNRFSSEFYNLGAVRREISRGSGFDGIDIGLRDGRRVQVRK